MNLLKWVACVVLSITLAACSQTQENQQSLIARGDYLLNGIMTCNHCHTPKDKAGNPFMARQFAGGAQRFDEVPFTATGSNITQGAGTGIGKWSDADIKRADEACGRKIDPRRYDKSGCIRRVAGAMSARRAQ